MTNPDVIVGLDIPPQRTSDRPADPILSVIGFAAGAGSISLLNVSIGAWVHLPGSNSVAAHVISISFLALLLILLLRLAEAAPRLRVSTAFLFLAGFVLVSPVLVSILAGVGAASISRAFAPLAGIIDALPPFVRFAISNFLGPVGEVCIGASVGRLFKHPNTLLAGAGFASFFDLVVVTMGPVAQLMNSGAGVISMVSVGAAAGSGVVAGASAAVARHPRAAHQLSLVTIGPADILFMAVFLGAVHQIGLARKASFWWIYSLLLIALILADTTPLPIPALIPMGIAVILANARFGAFTKTEKRDLAIGGAFAVCCAAGIIGGARRLLPAAPRTHHFGFMVTAPTSTKPMVISDITRNMPAEASGLHVGDEVLSIDGVPAASLSPSLLLKLAGKTTMSMQVKHPGDAAPIVVTMRAEQ